MKTVSVIIPVYNAQDYLAECLDSIVTQTLKEIEIICIDDGSTDNSYGIMCKYQEKYPNIVILQQKNQGAGVARNKGIGHANGKYVCFMDSDDCYAGNHVLNLLYTKAEENHVLACGGNLIMRNEDGEDKKRRNWFEESRKIQFAEYGDLYYYTCFIFDRKMLLNYNITFPSYRKYEDPPFLLCVMGHIREFYAVTEVVYVYRVGYKRTDYDYSRARDLLKGIRDCHKTAQKYDFRKTYDDHLKNALHSYLPFLYPYMNQNDGEIQNLINEVNDIRIQWMGEPSEVFRELEHMEMFVGQMRENMAVMAAKCRKARETVIYGAGVAGEFFCGKLEQEGINIAGFAVSHSDGERFKNGYAVREIAEYPKDVLVIVAANAIHAEEMIRQLERLKFENTMYIKYEDLKLLESWGL